MDSAPPRHVWWRSHQKGTFSSDINECICNNYLWNVNLTVNNIDIWLWYWGMIFLTYYKIFIHYFLIYLIYFVPYVLFENFGRGYMGTAILESEFFMITFWDSGNCWSLWLHLLNIFRPASDLLYHLPAIASSHYVCAGFNIHILSIWITFVNI